MRLFPISLGRTQVRLVQAGTALVAGALIAGCGNSYRPVVTPVNPSGPPAQPTSYAAVVSAPSPSSPGIITFIDYSGDTILTITPIGPGPRTFVMDALGSTGYTFDSDGTLANFGITTSLQAKDVHYSTLSSTANIVNLMAPQSGLWAADLDGNVADVFTGSSPQAFKLAIPVAPTPVTIVGTSSSSGQRQYAISQNFADPTGVACNTSPTAAPTGLATPIELATFTTDTPIALGKCPVYAVASPDQRRLFVLNRGDDTITVINAQNNALDQCVPYQSQSGEWITCHATLPLSTNAVTATGVTPPNGTTGMAATAGPVHAEYNPATNQIVVANYDAGTISVIDVTLDEYGNDYNTYANPTCTVGGVNSYANCGAVTGGFGTTYTIPVGKYPASVTVLADGSRAYTANQAVGTVTIANLASHTVEKTLSVVGHPRTVVSTQNSLYGKVYAASPDSPYLTILATLTDLVDTTILIEGNVVDVRVSTQNGTTGNSNTLSRTPGYGEPCNLPPTPGNPTPAPTGTQTLLQACRAIP
jgi:DNA-binding beta-propeller fold protein YncE